MTNEDIDAMNELASEMAWIDAINFIRSQDGRGLKEAGYTAHKIVREQPLSALAISYNTLPSDSASRLFFK